MFNILWATRVQREDKRTRITRGLRLSFTPSLTAAVVRNHVENHLLGPADSQSVIGRVIRCFNSVLRSSLFIEYFAIADREAHLGECRNILSRVGAQDHQVGFHVFRDAPGMVGIAELSRWMCRDRRENLLVVHASLRHESEFHRRVAMFGIPNIRSKQNIAARLWVSTEWSTIWATKASRCSSGAFPLRISTSNKVKVGIKLMRR
jgi:hypothetical protein